MVSFVEGRSMVGQFCSGGGCLLVLRHGLGYFSQFGCRTPKSGAPQR
jgi:hypothetical protein